MMNTQIQRGLVEITKLPASDEGVCHPHLVPKDAPALVYGGHNPRGWDSMSRQVPEEGAVMGKGGKGSTKRDACKQGGCTSMQEQSKQSMQRE